MIEKHSVVIVSGNLEESDECLRNKLNAQFSTIVTSLADIREDAIIITRAYKEGGDMVFQSTIDILKE